MRVGAARRNSVTSMFVQLNALGSKIPTILASFKKGDFVRIISLVMRKIFDKLSHTAFEWATIVTVIPVQGNIFFNFKQDRCDYNKLNAESFRKCEHKSGLAQRTVGGPNSYNRSSSFVTTSCTDTKLKTFAHGNTVAVREDSKSDPASQR